MSNLQRIQNVAQIIKMVEPDFNRLAEIHGAVHFEREASFALQILKNNDYLASIALGNPDSLKTSILNVAAIGSSLNPVLKLAYLVPRKKQICLDLSYRGLAKLGTDSGSILWAHADLVCEQDTFIQRGVGQAPDHQCNPFGERGEVVGAYCVAKTPDGDYLTTIMSRDEIISIRDRSEGFKAGSGPWLTDRNEMIKKTVIRRAYKMWPMTDARKRLDQAVDLSNEADPIELNAPPQAPSEPSARDQSLAKIRAALTEINRTESRFITHLAKTNNRKIEKLTDLTDIEINQALIFLSALPRPKPEEKNEVAG